MPYVDRSVQPGDNTDMSKKPADPCPCGLPADYAACCGRFHAGEAAPDAERLMRSRYSAYARGLADYLRQSWRSEERR